MFTIVTALNEEGILWNEQVVSLEISSRVSCITFTTVSLSIKLGQSYLIGL